jgi:hypothetical protein
MSALMPSTSNVSECAMEFLLEQVLEYSSISTSNNSSSNNTNIDTPPNKTALHSSTTSPSTSSQEEEDEIGAKMNSLSLANTTATAAGAGAGAAPSSDSSVLAAEAAMAKIEEFGFVVGFKFAARISSGGGGAAGGAKVMDAGNPLDVIKFLCKDFWMMVFGKQIDKLQT